MPLGGKTYHVQTEDCALKTPVVSTLLYLDGEILASKKTDYSSLLAGPDPDSRIRKLMVFQHRLMIKELISGTYTSGGPGKQDIRLQPE